MRRRFCFSGTPNLYIKNGRYFYRLQMTACLYPHLGPREIRRPLRTGDIKTARLRYALADLLVKKLIVNTEHMMTRVLTLLC